MKNLRRFIPKIALTLALLFMGGVSAQATHTTEPLFTIFYYLQNPSTGVKFQVAGVDYIRHLPSGANWLDGDRLSYACAFTFLEWEGVKVARVTFVKVSNFQDLTMAINDKFMHESGEGASSSLAHDWYGNPYPPDDATHDNQQDCLGEPTSKDAVAKAASLAGGSFTGMVERPAIVFTDEKTGLEVRDYANARVSNPDRANFRIVSATPDRIIVVSYWDGQPIVATFYDRLSPGIRMTHNGSF